MDGNGAQQKIKKKKVGLRTENIEDYLEFDFHMAFLFFFLDPLISK